MDNVIDLKKELYIALQDSSEIVLYNAKLRDRYEKQEKKINREREQWDRDRKKWGKKLGGANTEIQKLRTHDLELIDEARCLQIENANKDISLAKSKAENDIKSKKIKSLESMIKILEGKLSSAQKDVILIQSDSSKKETEITSLKSKIAELENIKSKLEKAKPRDYVSSKVNELECLKSETISKPIVGGDDEKNITKSDNISLGSTDLSKYFIRRKNMDQTEKTDGNILTYTNDEITELSKNDTEANSKVSNETSISKISEDNMSTLIESNSQMRPGPEALPLPAVASTLMSPLSAYIFLILFIISVMWFVRCTWGLERKSDRFWDIWIG
ncbi:hypothetical protein C2G38_2246320 [Gigaspora rosea]|uniref:Uncharacterized protein n=1 Tax=Gigaspora rosea TaxID=44941 RepID=A0A397V569_9GLOM|nr:hypothetical protein C2G38_2246320 [Gigaspora rosea]